MKHNIKSLIGFTMGATNGEIGKVKDFYFDDHSWTVRYIIVETGNWLSGRKVLISPESLLKVDMENEVFAVNLTTQQIEQSPDIDTEKPVSRQQEEELNRHYPWSNYWIGGMGNGLGPGDLWAGGIGTTGMMMGSMSSLTGRPEEEENNEPVEEPKGDPQLRSYDKVKGYSISATDGGIGDVEDFILDDTTWKIDLLIIDTGNWLPGKKVLVSPHWITEIDWLTSTVKVNVSIDKIKASPEYDPTQSLSEDYQKAFYSYYSNP